MEVNIDFEDASKCWRQNKKHDGNGYFVYICSYIHSSNGKRCRKVIYSQKLKNPYATMFVEVDRYKNHDNKDIFCKKHLCREIK
jgi:hypothetical protein